MKLVNERRRYVCAACKAVVSEDSERHEYAVLNPDGTTARTLQICSECAGVLLDSKHKHPEENKDA